MLSLNQLKTFMAVVKFGSFTRAARELNLTQPAVSGHIASLEKEVGAKLFTRTGKSIVITDAGGILVTYGKNVIEQLDRMADELEDLKNLKGGKITLGASRIMGVYVLPKLLTDFQEQFPGISLRLRVHSAHTVLQQLEDNAYDLAVIAEGLPIASPNIGFKVIGKDPLVIIAPPSHPLAKAGSITVSEVCSEHFILPGNQTASAANLRKILKDVGIRLNSTIEMNEQGAIKRAVEEGAGLAIMSRAVVDREIREKRLVELRMENWRPSRRILLLWRQDRQFSKNTEAFMKFLNRWLKHNL